MKKLYKKIFKKEKGLNNPSVTQKKNENAFLKRSLFDAEYYYEMYPDVLKSNIDALEHYDTIGWKELKNPSEKFNTASYLNANADVKNSGLNPLTHYVTFGHLEARQIYPVITANVVTEVVATSEETVTVDQATTNEQAETNEQNVDAEQAETNEQNVDNEQSLLNFLFDEEYYLNHNHDVKSADIDPYEHFLNFGWKENRNPSAYFNVHEYLELNPDIKEAGINPLLHFVEYGRYEGRELNPKVQGSPKHENIYNELTAMCFGHSAGPEYAPCIDAPVVNKKDAPKVIAFYLPQFHPFKENDEWWGKGFTEWTNVAKAIPQFEGHYQPRLPSDLGYYDLRLPEVMKEQTEIARAHGVDGFCFHYYWFAGHRLMERPIEQYLAEKENIDFPFSLCWANENWTRRWDGSENDVLMAQEHSEADNEAVFYDLLRYFKDERYIKVDGKPLLVIYRPDIIPDINALTTQLRALALKEGLPGLHLVATNAFGFDQHRELGFDAIVEFPPHNIKAECINYQITPLNEGFSGYVFKYDDVIDHSLARLHNMEDKELASGYYPTVMAGWDNSARKPGKGHVFHGATPARFQYWLEGNYRWSQESHPTGAQFVFINAWNEWAEGTYMEPDKKYGYAYLNAVRSTVNEVLTDAVQLNEFAATVKGTKESDSIVIAHVFYEDLVDDICDEIIEAKNHKKLDVALSIPNSFSLNAVKKLVKCLKPVKLVVSENRGRDVWPFLQTLSALKGLGYKYGCKIHSKKSTHIAKGAEWRRSIYSGLLSKQAINSFECLATKSKQLAIAAPEDFMYPLDGYALRDNVVAIDEISSIYDIADVDYQPFVAGTMFWFSFDWAEKLESNLVNRELFGPELGAIDGTVAHAFERMFSTIAVNTGGEVSSYSCDVDFVPYERNK